MRRREFITLLSGAAAWPLAARAQQAGRTYRLGFVSAAPRDEAWYTAFFEELHGLGFVEMQHTRVVWSFRFFQRARRKRSHQP
jgi:putative tryptophan/tyrosine transport system substrate-binding protein